MRIGGDVRRSVWAAIAVLLWLLATPAFAASTGIDLYRNLCTVRLPDTASDTAVAAAPYRCDGDAPTDSDQWLWVRLNPAMVRDLPAGWQLLVDQARFDRIAILVDTPAGPRRTVRGATELAGNWVSGGMLRFDIAAAGRDVRGLYIGFERIDDLSLMRKVRAVDRAMGRAGDPFWLILMGVFTGTMVSALFYNLVIHAGRRYSFQRWYLRWVLIALAYGLAWTNMLAFVVPGLAGPWAVRLDYVLVGLMIATGNMFFFAVIEDGILPRWLRRLGAGLALAGAVLGVAAAADHLFPVVLTDRWLNYVIAATALSVAVSCVVAARRGSRVVWFYVVGWGPVIAVFVARLTRNLGLVPQNDMVDMATFAAIAFEALVLSLAIADRFRLLRQELDQATRRQEMDRIEAKALRASAHTDFLTGLGNRGAFQEALGQCVDRSAPFALFLIDVDYLKDANDRMGHAGGDMLLQWIGTALTAIAADVPGTRVARIGGDEFALLVDAGQAGEETVISRLNDLQETYWRYHDAERRISLSIGLARFPIDATSADRLYRNADMALYQAKRLGRCRLYVYDSLLRNLHDMETALTRDAEAALERDEFRLFLQPIVLLPSGQICGYEALLRWQHPYEGLLLPGRFAETLIAERIGPRIQEHVLEMALSLLRTRRQEVMTLSVNFTAAQLTGARAAQRILDRIAYHGVSPSALCVEVTEGVMLDRAADDILTALEMLHRAGVRIALDDFGTGYASLVHLRRMPIDRIKIDRSFIATLDEPGGSTLAIVRAIIGMACGLGKVVVAEGIETEEQARQLGLLGCHLGQGYLFGRPAPEPLAVVAAA